MEFFDRWLNLDLLKEPLNWAIVFVMASISLLLMHVVMVAFGAMQSTKPQGAFAGPGQISIPDATGNFSQPGVLAGNTSGNNLGGFYGGATQKWTDGIESKYAEDGWTGNS